MSCGCCWPGGRHPDRRQVMRAGAWSVVALCTLGAGGAAAQRRTRQSLIRDAEIERTIDRMTQPILRAANIPRASVSVYIVNDRRINAFVAAGRNMFLNTGLLMELETPEELIGVIAHETGHIAGGHTARRQQEISAAAGPALIGTLLGIAAAAAGAPEVGLAAIAGSQSIALRNLLRYSRGEEAAADQAALGYLDRAGVSPEGLRRVLQRFRGQEVLSVGNLDPYTLTHPLSTDRLQLIERAANEAASRNFPADPERDYWHARMRAKLEGFLDRPERVLDRTAEEPDTELALYASAVAYHRLPDPVRAVETVDRLIAVRPDDPFYIELKGQILYEAGDARGAEPLYRRASALAPHEPLLLAGLGRMLLAIGGEANEREALGVLAEARRADPADSSMMRDLAIAYDRAGDRGMATLVTAERYALNGRVRDARLHAGRAEQVLPQGSPGWLRAQDILAMKIPDE
ncbi:MAG: M48 family metalloprotease [Pseudomonadota bacterium]